MNHIGSADIRPNEYAVLTLPGPKLVYCVTGDGTVEVWNPLGTTVATPSKIDHRPASLPDDRVMEESFLFIKSLGVPRREAMELWGRIGEADRVAADKAVPAMILARR